MLPSRQPATSTPASMRAAATLSCSARMAATTLPAVITSLASAPAAISSRITSPWPPSYAARSAVVPACGPLAAAAFTSTPPGAASSADTAAASPVAAVTTIQCNRSQLYGSLAAAVVMRTHREGYFKRHRSVPRAFSCSCDGVSSRCGRREHQPQRTGCRWSESSQSPVARPRLGDSGATITTRRIRHCSPVGGTDAGRVLLDGLVLAVPQLLLMGEADGATRGAGQPDATRGSALHAQAAPPARPQPLHQPQLPCLGARRRVRKPQRAHTSAGGERTLPFERRRRLRQRRLVRLGAARGESTSVRAFSGRTERRCGGRCMARRVNTQRRCGGRSGELHRRLCHQRWAQQAGRQGAAGAGPLPASASDNACTCI